MGHVFIPQLVVISSIKPISTCISVRFAFDEEEKKLKPQTVAEKWSCVKGIRNFSCVFKTKIIADPTAKEEEVTSETFTVITNEKDSVIYLERPGEIK